MVAAHPLSRGHRARLLAPVLALALAVGLGQGRGAAAHPFHASYAELSWSEAGDALEVALRVIPEDLETALSRDAGSRVLLDPEAPPAELIEAYLGRDDDEVDLAALHQVPGGIVGDDVVRDALLRQLPRGEDGPL